MEDYKDGDKPEAVFYGLKTAIRGIGMSAEHTNLVILVGSPTRRGVNEPDVMDDRSDLGISWQ